MNLGDVVPLQVMVYKFSIRLVFVLSVSFLLMHNLTPHVHHSEMSEEQHIFQHEEAKTLYDWLMLSFHDDLGGGHLECFSQLEKIELNPARDFVIPSDFLLSIPLVDASFIQSDQDVCLKDHFFGWSIMERICYDQHMFGRPPPIA